MKNICDIVQDLLPLYLDGICSEGSCEFVEEHISECEKCSGTLSKLKNTEYDKEIIDEKEKVIQYTYKKTKQRTFLAGGVIAGILMIPVVICLIVNLATGHALNWFFIVLTSLMVTASLTVVPLMAADKKFLYTRLSFVAALLLLFGVCCIYTKGRWFFVASVSVLLGMATVILPILVQKYFPSGFWKRNKGLLVYCADTVLLLLLFLSIAVYLKSTGFLIIALKIAAVPVLSMWIMLLIIRYLRANKAVRTGVAMSFFGAFVLVINPLINYIIGYPEYLYFSSDNYINTIISLGLAAAGIIVMIAGAVIGKIIKNRKDQV